MTARIREQPHRTPAKPRTLSYDAGQTGRLANTFHEIASTVGMARRLGADVAFPSSWVYREWLSCPDSWFRDDLTGTVPSTVFARRFCPQLSPAAVPYLQALALWDNVQDEVRAAFTPSAAARTILDEIWAEQFARYTDRPMVAVHVRRGDTITRNPADSINPLPASYYSDGVATLTSGFPSRAAVVVFTDDPEWCEANLDCDFVYRGVIGPEDTADDYTIRPRLDWIDLFLMTRMNGGIAISNSSYSWWSAWLSSSTNVCYPSRWYGSRLLRAGFDISLILPNNWECVPTV